MGGMYISIHEGHEAAQRIRCFGCRVLSSDRRATTRVAPTGMEAGLVCECRSMLIIERHWIDLEQGRAGYLGTYIRNPYKGGWKWRDWL